MTIDITSQLLGPSSPTVKFEVEGDVRKIRITDIDRTQETSYDTNEPVFWPNGEPKMQYVLRGVVDGEESRMFVKGYMIEALREALRKAGVTAGDSLVGGTLAFKWDSTDAPRKAGMKGARRYVAQYEAAPKGVVGDDLI